MAYVIAEPCIGVKDTACVNACPVDCIHPRKDEADFNSSAQLYIDPQECIDCGACVPVCPVSAIFARSSSEVGSFRSGQCRPLRKLHSGSHIGGILAPATAGAPPEVDRRIPDRLPGTSESKRV